MLRAAAELRHARFDVGVEPLPVGERTAGGENDFRGLGRELTAASDAPACTITGQPSGGRAMLRGPRTFKN